MELWKESARRNIEEEESPLRVCLEGPSGLWNSLGQSVRLHGTPWRIRNMQNIMFVRVNADITELNLHLRRKITIVNFDTAIKHHSVDFS